MVEVFGVGIAIYFSPKNLGLNARFLGLCSDSPRVEYWVCFRTAHN